MNDLRRLRNALGIFTTGVTIVTTVDGEGRDVGVTANSFSSVSLDPPLVLWSLAHSSKSLQAFLHSTHFAVHVLAADQDQLASLFAQRGADRFSGLILGRGPGGVPLIEGCSARFQCRVAYRYEGGDHVIFVGEVLDYDHVERAPLVFHRGRFALAVSKNSAEAAPSGEAQIDLREDSLLQLLARAHSQLQQRAEGEKNLDPDEVMILKQLLQAIIRGSDP